MEANKTSKREQPEKLRDLELILYKEVQLSNVTPLSLGSSYKSWQIFCGKGVIWGVIFLAE